MTEIVNYKNRKIQIKRPSVVVTAYGCLSCADIQPECRGGHNQSVISFITGREANFPALSAYAHLITF